MAIAYGTQVEVVTALGEKVVMRALSGPEPGHDFEVVWVATEAEFAESERTEQDPDGIPWPSSALRVLEPS
jgi:hypothetical protein